MTQEEPAIDRHRIEVDGEWDLLEFSNFGRQYVQVYSILYAFHFGANQDNPDDRTLHAFRAFPWKGGWSTVGFYDSLRFAMPRNHRPRIVAIEYASPGYMDLLAVPGVSLAIRWTISNVCSGIDQMNATYGKLQKGSADRKLNKIDVRRKELQLAREELQFAEDAARQLMTMMGLDDLSDEFLRLTDSPLARMKIAFSIYRRVRKLSKLQNSHKILF